jgi:hypothetical protein
MTKILSCSETFYSGVNRMGERHKFNEVFFKKIYSSHFVPFQKRLEEWPRENSVYYAFR